MRRRLRWWSAPLLAAPLALGACKSDTTREAGPQEQVPSDSTAPTAEPAEPLPALRTGDREPAEHPELPARFAAYRVEGGAEYLDLRMPIAGDDLGLDWDRLQIELADAGPGQLALMETRTGASEAIVLVRRPKSAAAPSELRGALYAQRWHEGAHGWVRVPFVATGAVAKADDRELPGRWADAVESVLGDTWLRPHPWNQFAVGRIRTWLKKQGAGGLPSDAVMQDPTQRTDLALLMDTTTGALSMQEALQHDRGLRLPRTSGPRTLAIADLQPPPLEAHPFAAMQAALPNPGGGAPEALAAAAPAEFWYARVDDIRLMLRLLDEADTWITPVVQILQQNPEDRGLTDRYQRQLGLRRSDLARALGHTVVGQVAMVGSDPYVREGTDLTLIFQLKQPELFDAELKRQLETYRADAPGLVLDSRENQGVQISRALDPAGLVRQHRATIGDLAFVSNSPRALEKILDAVAGRAPRLQDEPDLKYMLARDPGARPAFAFLSDRFIAAVIGPRQKIAAARRQQALAELLVPGYAALLHGWLFGQAPASTEALLASGLLGKDELAHADGGAAITFAPGAPARSSWGSPEALTPLVDLPAVDKVSEAEKLAYDAFSSTYQTYWKRFIDPVAIRLGVEDGPEGAVASIDVRVLPLISGTDYGDIGEIVGKTRVHVEAVDRGLLAVWAVGQESGLRRDLDGLMRSLTGQSDAGLGWLGDWVLVGLDDRAALLELFARFDVHAQLPAPKNAASELEDLELWSAVGRFPIYAAAAVRNPAGLVATLTALKTTLNSVAPGMVEWGEVARHRDLPIVRVGVSPSAPLLPNKKIAEAFALHYAQTGSAIALAFDRPTLQRVIDQILDGRLPKSDAESSSQFVVQSRSGAGAPLWTAGLWMLQGQANAATGSALRSAEIVLRGDPERTRTPDEFARLARAYLGFAPLNARGTAEFVLRPEGAADPQLGSAIAPSYPPLPIAGSPIERLMQRLTALRGEVAFDPEPEVAGADARSLRTRLQLHLGAAP